MKKVNKVFDNLGKMDPAMWGYEMLGQKTINEK